MIKCNFCKKEIISLVPWKCSRCKKIYCTKHRLPEYHKCKTYPKTFFVPIGGNEPKPEKGSKPKEGVPSPFDNKLKYYLKNIKSFLFGGKHRTYNNINSFIMNIFVVVVLFFTLSIIYTNVDKLNDIFFLGFLLLAINIGYLIKFVFELFLDVKKLISNSKNWVKIVLGIFVLILVIQAYGSKETFFDDLIEKYENLDFIKIFDTTKNIEEFNTTETREEIYLGITCSLVDDSIGTQCDNKCQEKSMNYEEFYCEGDSQGGLLVCVCSDNEQIDDFTLGVENGRF